MNMEIWFLIKLIRMKYLTSDLFQRSFIMDYDVLASVRIACVWLEFVVGMIVSVGMILWIRMDY